MKTLITKQTVKLVSTLTLSLVVFGTALFAQPSFEVTGDVNEDELMVQEWMTSYDAFSVDYTSENYYEEVLEIQNWMTDLDQFNNELSDDYNEELIAIETWMVDYDAFTSEVDEPLLAIEDWMLDYSAFVEEEYDMDSFLAETDEEPLEVEVWMTNLTAFNTISTNFLPSIDMIDLNETEPVLVALHTVK